MNPKVALIMATTIMMIFCFPLLTAGPTDPTKIGLSVLIVYIGIVATILAWAPRQRP